MHQKAVTPPAVNADIFTEGDDIPGLYANACDAIRCHFGEDKEPTLIRRC